MRKKKSERIRCFHGGDVGPNGRSCLHPRVIKELGLRAPTDIASRVDLGFCNQCIHFRLEEKEDEQN